jgi:nucleolysin TIA-1/TIAR
METGKSRQFAFVSFRERGDAHRALREKSGVILKKRRILISYGNLKFYSKSLPLSAEAAPKSNLLFDVKQDALKNLNDNEKYSVVVLQTPISCCTVYFGNIAPDVNWGDLEKLLVPYGKVLELTVYSERSYAFSRLDTHENAARAIIGLQGSIVKGKAIRTAWRDRTIRDKMVDQWVLPQASASQVQLRALASMGGHHGTCEDPSSMNPNAMPFSDPRTLPSQGSIAPMPYTPVAAPGQPIMYQPMPSIQLMASMPPMARMGYQSGMLYPQDYNMQYPHGHNIPYPQGRNTQNPPQAYDPGMYAMAQAYPNTMAAYGDDPANLEHSMSRMRV